MFSLCLYLNFAECPIGSYTVPNRPCVPCPANSFTEERGESECQCRHGYYRAHKKDSIHDGCTSKSLLNNPVRKSRKLALYIQFHVFRGVPCKIQLHLTVQSAIGIASMFVCLVVQLFMYMLLCSISCSISTT